MSGRRSGFTLIELLVVMAVITLIVMVAVPSISSYFRVSLGSATRDMASVFKEAYNTTLITGKVHRMVYDISKGQYWVEVGPDNVMLENKASREKEERKNMLSFDHKEKKSQFQLDSTVTRHKKSLPMGVKFVDVITEQGKDPITDGLAYTHIFPSGMTELTLVHLKDSDGHQTSLRVTPILGKTDVYENYVKPEDVFGTE